MTCPSSPLTVDDAGFSTAAEMAAHCLSEEQKASNWASERMGTLSSTHRMSVVRVMIVPAFFRKPLQASHTMMRTVRTRGMR